MKTLELNQMEQVQGGDWMLGFSCVSMVLLAAATTAATVGAGTILAGYAAAAVCGWKIGEATS